MATEQSFASWFWEKENNNKINRASEENAVNTGKE